MTTTAATILAHLKPSQIKPHKNNPRRDVGDVDELAASIAEQGIIEPLIVAPGEGGYIADDLVPIGPFILIAGHRRLAAARQAKSATVPCIVRSDLTDAGAQLEAMLVENLQRTDLTAVEEAQAYQQLLAFPGYTQPKIAKATGRAIATVRARLKLAELPKPTLSKIHQGQISLTEAQALVDFAGDKAAYKRLERAAGTDSFGRELQTIKNARTLERKVTRLTKQLQDGGVRIVDDPHYSKPIKRLYGKKEVDEHRECPGFCAYITKQNFSYSTPSASASYICDQPQLHVEEDSSAGEKRVAEHAEQNAKLAAAAVTRRAHLAAVLTDQAAAEKHALDLLRQYALKQIHYENWIQVLLTGEDRPATKSVAAAVDKLSLEQLAVLLDLSLHTSAERSLEQHYAWGSTGSYNGGKAWRTRLESVYGYQWSDFERELIDAGTATAAVDDGDEDLVDDFDDDEEWADE